MRATPIRKKEGPPNTPTDQHRCAVLEYPLITAGATLDRLPKLYDGFHAK
jgi:hypothetical protein